MFLHHLIFFFFDIVPDSNTQNIQAPETSTTNATFIFGDQIFDVSQGDIKYYAIIINVGPEISTEIGGKYGFWDSLSWPESGFWLETAERYEYQVTPKYWNPFENATTS